MWGSVSFLQWVISAVSHCQLCSGVTEGVGDSYHMVTAHQLGKPPTLDSTNSCTQEALLWQYYPEPLQIIRVLGATLGNSRICVCVWSHMQPPSSLLLLQSLASLSSSDRFHKTKIGIKSQPSSWFKTLDGEVIFQRHEDLAVFSHFSWHRSLSLLKLRFPLLLIHPFTVFVLIRGVKLQSTPQQKKFSLTL